MLWCMLLHPIWNAMFAQCRVNWRHNQPQKEKLLVNNAENSRVNFSRKPHPILHPLANSQLSIKQQEDEGWCVKSVSESGLCAFVIGV